MAMVWTAALLLLCSSGNAEEMRHNDGLKVPISGNFYGARFRTDLNIRTSPETHSTDAYKVLYQNAEQLTDLSTWVDNSARRFHFDAYGKTQLVVSTVDAIGLRTFDRRRNVTKTVRHALQQGKWTKDDRLLAIGGGLIALGYNVALFENGDQLMLGLGTQDPDLNVESIRQTWTLGRRSNTHEVFVEWVLWDGESRIGSIERFGGNFDLNEVTQLNPSPPKGEYFSFTQRKIPRFALKKKQRVRLRVAGSRQHLYFNQYPKLAQWFRMYPEFKFERQVQFLNQERKLINMGPSVRRLAMKAESENEAINQLLRTLQTEFTYKKGPLRSMAEVLDTREGDCDQLAMLMLIALREMGYKERDLVSIRWPGHLALGVRAKHEVPDSNAVVLNRGRYVILDTTHYLYSNGDLVSRWGSVADEYDSQVTVGSLAAMKRKKPGS